jgi:spoIIIJ-associated protein
VSNTVPETTPDIAVDNHNGTEPLNGTTPSSGTEPSSGTDNANDSSSADAVDVEASPTEGGGSRSVVQLEEEGDIAADYIEELLDITDLDGDIDIDARDGRAYVSVNSSQDSNLRLLSKPDTVNALQELTRIAVQAKTGVFSRLILDVGGSRQAREAELSALVERAADRLEAGAESAALPPMSSYERKLVHDLVAARGFVSESEGEGADRHTVISRR